MSDAVIQEALAVFEGECLCCKSLAENQHVLRSRLHWEEYLAGNGPHHVLFTYAHWERARVMMLERL